MKSQAAAALDSCSFSVSHYLTFHRYKLKKNIYYALPDMTNDLQRPSVENATQTKTRKQRTKLQVKNKSQTIEEQSVRNGRQLSLDVRKFSSRVGKLLVMSIHILHLSSLHRPFSLVSPPCLPTYTLPLLVNPLSSRLYCNSSLTFNVRLLFFLHAV